MELISAEAAEILGDNDPDFTVFHVGDHLLERWPLEIAAGKTIVYIEAGIGKVMAFREFLQDIFLILNAVGIALQTVILTETAVRGGFLFLRSSPHYPSRRNSRVNNGN